MATGASPNVVENQATDEPTVYYENSGGAMAGWQWHPVTGWEDAVL